MVVIDLKGMREEFVAYIMGIATSLGWLELGVAMLTIGTLAAIRELIIEWKKRKGFRMAVRERATKETELLGQIINDGLFEAELAGKISEQRMKALYKLCSEKLDIPDLVPKQTRLKIVKEEVKRRLIKDYKIKPETLTKTTFSETIGGFANKFWRKAS